MNTIFKSKKTIKHKYLDYYYYERVEVLVEEIERMGEDLKSQLDSTYFD